MSRWPSSAFATDYRPKILERIEEVRRYPPRIPPARPSEGQDYYSMVAKHGRPYGAFEKERRLSYCAAPFELSRRRDNWEDGQ
jgi:hypothetical protein